MPGIRIEVACDVCGKPTRMRTGAIAALRTREQEIRCDACRAAAERVRANAYSNRLNAANREGRARDAVQGVSALGGTHPV